MAIEDVSTRKRARRILFIGLLKTGRKVKSVEKIVSKFSIDETVFDDP